MGLLPKQKDLELARQDGSMTKMCRLLSAVYFITQIQSVLFSDVTDIASEYKIYVGDLKHVGNKVMKAHDDFSAAFRDLIEHSENKNLIHEDFDNLFIPICRYLGIENIIREDYPVEDKQLDENDLGEKIRISFTTNAKLKEELDKFCLEHNAERGHLIHEILMNFINLSYKEQLKK